MGALVWIPLAFPVLLAGAALAGRRSPRVRYAPPLASVVTLVCGILLVLSVRSGAPLTAAAGLLRVDALSAYMVTAVGAVALTATWAGLVPRGHVGPADHRFASLLCLFLGAMTVAVTADNLGVMWVAIEATTITTAFLVGHHGDRRALEAAWKYVVLGSVGVSLAFLGIVLIYAATTAAGAPTLSWAVLRGSELPLDPQLTRAGVALAALGFATKAGLAPMHSWLPDAHSQAPAAVSGLMSGVLLSVAFYAILRIQAISDTILGPGLMRGLLGAAGLLSLLVAAAMVITQGDYKRLLAYSSVEHMGLLALGAAVGGPLATGAVLLHLLGHGLAKASVFVVAGRILATEGSTRVAAIRSLLSRRPELAIPFLAGTAALLGFPPSVLFFTEVAIVVAGWQRGLGWVMAPALALLLVVFAGLARHALVMTLASHDTRSAPVESPDPHGAATGPMLPLVLALSLVGALGALTWPLAGTLGAAVAALGGGR